MHDLHYLIKFKVALYIFTIARVLLMRANRDLPASRRNLVMFKYSPVPEFSLAHACYMGLSASAPGFNPLYMARGRESSGTGLDQVRIYVTHFNAKSNRNGFLRPDNAV